MASSGLGVASKMSEERPVVHAVRASWINPADRGEGIAGIDKIAFETVLKYASDRQQNFETRIHEVASRLITTLATAGPNVYGAAVLTVMDWTSQTKRTLVHERALVAGALLSAAKPTIPATFLASGKTCADKVGGGRDDEAKSDLQAVVAPRVGAEYRDAAFAAWTALLHIT